jgi:HEAT repeat protein
MALPLFKRKPADIERLKRENDIHGLIRLLKDRDYTTQWKAAEALGTMGDVSLGHLTNALRDPDRDVRLGAIEALGQLREPSAVPALIHVLGTDRNTEIRWAAALALGEIGDQESVPSLVREQRDPDKYVRYGAAIALDRLGWVAQDPDDRTWYLIARQDWSQLKKEPEISTKALIRATRDRDTRVRTEAVETLGDHADPLACEAIEPVLKDRDSGVLWKAVTSFQKCSVPALYIPMGLAKRPRFGKNPWVAAFLNFFFVGLGYNYLGMWWGFLLFQTNLTIILLASIQMGGPLVPTVASYSVSALFSTHSWLMARSMPEM